MRTSEPKPHQINELLVSFDSEVRKRGCGTMMRTSESGHSPGSNGYGRRFVATETPRSIKQWKRCLPPRHTRSRRRLDRDHLEGVHVAVFTADRDIFAVAKGVVAEAIAGLVVVLRGLVIVEYPARVLGAAGLVDETPELVVLVIPESTYAAMFAVFPPKLGIDVSSGVKGSDEFIAVLVRARGEVLRASEIEPDALEHVRQLRHDGAPRSGAGAMINCIARRTVLVSPTLTRLDPAQEHCRGQIGDAAARGRPAHE